MIDFNMLCQRFALCDPINTKKLNGKFLHELWELNTLDGRFAIKKLNLNNLALLAHNLAVPDLSQKIAYQLELAGLKTACALKSVNDNFVEVIKDAHFMVFPWIEGENLFSHFSVTMLENIGQCLGMIHDAKLKMDGLILPKWFGFSERHLESLIKNLSIDHQTHLYLHLQDILRWNQFAAFAAEYKDHWVLSHRDFDPKNVLWSDPTTPVLLDWEYAGWIDQTLDLFIVSLNWSFSQYSEIDENRFKVVWDSYAESTKKNLKLTPEILNSYFGYCLDWIEFNLKRYTCKNSRETAWQEICYSIQAMRQVERVYPRLMESGLKT